MANSYIIRQLLDEISLPESGKQSVLLADNADLKSLLFAFAAGEGMTEHQAPLPVTIQIVQGEVDLMIDGEHFDGRSGTWVHLPANTPHSVSAKSPTILHLTLIK